MASPGRELAKQVSFGNVAIKIHPALIAPEVVPRLAYLLSRLWITLGPVGNEKRMGAPLPRLWVALSEAALGQEEVWV